jgi:putative heme-binding domain-containing protein
MYTLYVSAAAAALICAAAMVLQASQNEPGVQEPAPFNREWTMTELLPAIADLGKGRDWMQGGRVFEQAGCGICHAFSTYWEGNGLAPDLTSVGSKFTRDIILQSILEPSAQINGQYYNTRFTLKDGTVLDGSIVNNRPGTLVVAPVMMVPDVTVEIAETDVKSELPSPVSPMPPGLLNGFTREQILDLLAFLDAGGDPDAAIYRK